MGRLLMVWALAACLHAQPPAPWQPAQFDPSDVFFQGYLAVRAAEDLEKNGDFSGAVEKLERANQMFDTIRKFYPDWKSDMVRGRAEKTVQALSAAKPKAEEAKQRDRGVIAELEGGRRVPAAPASPAQSPAVRTTPQADQPPGLLDVDPVTLKRLREAEAERDRLKNMLEEQSARAHRQAEKRIQAQAERMQAEAKSKEETLRAEIQAKQDGLDRARDQMLAEQDQLAAEAAAREARFRNEAEQSRAESSAQDRAMGRNKELEEQLAAAEQQVKSLRASLATAPLQSEMDGLTQRIDTLELERRALSTALGKSREQHEETVSRIKTLEVDLQISRQKHADLQRNMEVERNLSNEVVAGQRRQMQALEKQLQTKSAELAQANARISGLTRELEESRAAFAELRGQRDALLFERDQMAAVLKLNESGRVQELIEQNMALARDLRVANEKVERLHQENNQDKDAITNAMRDLAIAKSQINRLQQEKRDQDSRLAEMQAKLVAEEKRLAQQDGAAGDPAELEFLREIIRRQLKVQERRRQARDILLDTVRDLGKQDGRLAEAIELFDAQEIELSPEEMKLVADKQVDGEFISPFARDRATVGHATDTLRSEIAAFERAAEKSFLAGRYLSTREIYQSILDQNPGHTPSLCRIGIVHLKLHEADAASDLFRRAAELDEGNAYAFRMLGYSLMLTGDLSGAEQAARKSVDLAPEDATSHMLLATLCYRSSRMPEAESYFKAAITADPLPSEPYYNLALLYARTGRMEEAREQYQAALERGAVPDPALENNLHSR